MNKNASTSTNVVTYQVNSSSKASKARSFLSALCWMSNSDDASTNKHKKINFNKGKDRNLNCIRPKCMRKVWFYSKLIAIQIFMLFIYLGLTWWRYKWAKFEKFKKSSWWNVETEKDWYLKRKSLTFKAYDTCWD